MRHSRILPLPLLMLLILLQLGSACARADIAIIVHPQNPLTELSESDLKKIFLGRLPLFPKTGQEIHPLDLPEEHATFTDFYRRLLQLDGTKLRRYRAYYLFSGRGRLPATTDTVTEMISKVAEDPAAIGYVDATNVTAQVKTLLVLRTTTGTAQVAPTPPSNLPGEATPPP